MEKCPTKHKIRNIYAKTPQNKQTGPEQIGGELLSRCADEMAAIATPLHAKCHIRTQEPWGYKGGVAAPLPKSGSTASMDNFRSVLLSSPSGKNAHKAQRRDFESSFYRHLRNGQHGGVKKRGTDMANIRVRLWNRAQKAQGRCSGVLFLDCVSAFYSVIRQLAVKVPHKESEIEHIIDGLRLSEQAKEEVRKRIGDKQNALDRYECTQHEEAIIAEAHQDTWFATAGCNKVAVASKGTRPGDPWGDIIWNVLHAQVMTEVEEK